MSPNNNKNNENSTGIIDQAREFIHENVKTQEQRDAEKSVTEKMKNKIPESAEETGSAVGKTIDSGIQTFKDGFAERLAEDSDGNKIRETNQDDPCDSPGLLSSAMQKTKDGVQNAREHIYNVTKSEQEKEADRQAEMSILDKVKETLSTDLQSKGIKLDEKFDAVKEQLPRETNTLENAGAKIDDGFEKVKEQLPREINTLDDTGVKIDDGFENVKEDLKNKLSIEKHD